MRLGVNHQQRPYYEQPQNSMGIANTFSQSLCLRLDVADPAR